MLKPFYYILFIALLVSCRKKDKLVNTDEVRILKTSASFNGVTGNQIFDYDGQGRIIRISGNTNNEPPQTSATITYNGNEVLLKEPDVVSAAVKISSEIKYTLDAGKKPLQRIRVETQEYFPPNNPQRNFTNDTTYYEYDAGGLLTKATNNNRDSSSLEQAGLTGTSLRLKRVVYSYSYNNGNLTSVAGLGTSFSRVFNGSISKEFNTTLEESLLFNYTKGYSNKTDFSNAFILSEYNILFTLPYPLNKSYKNIPDKITRQSVEKDASGAPMFTNSETVNYIASYNKYGFLSNLNSIAGPSSGLNLIYNK
jgi:hypothetical protein